MKSSPRLLFSSSILLFLLCFTSVEVSSGNTSNAINFDSGGIESLGATFVTGSTISGNTQITNTERGAGGIFIGNEPLTITNSTITNNSANNAAQPAYSTQAAAEVLCC